MANWKRLKVCHSWTSHTVAITGKAPGRTWERFPAVVWPAHLHLFAVLECQGSRHDVVNDPRPGEGPWHWKLYEGGKLVDSGEAKKEAGARSAVMRHVRPLIAIRRETIHLPKSALREGERFRDLPKSARKAR